MKALLRKSFYLTVSMLALTACAQQSAQINVRPVSNGELAEALPSGSNLYDMGKSDLQQSRLALAIDTFRQDLRLNGDSVKTLNGLGITYDMLGRYDLSQKYYERALAIDPSSSVTFSNLAYSQYKQGNYADAKVLAAKAEKLLASQQADKNAATEKNATAETLVKNLEVADDKKIKEEDVKDAQDDSAPVHNQLERVGDRDWEVVQEKDRQIAETAVKYKSSLPIQQILDDSDAVGKEQVQETQALEMPVQEMSAQSSQARTEPVQLENMPLAAESTEKHEDNLALRQILDGVKTADEEQPQAKPVQQGPVAEEQHQTVKSAAIYSHNLGHDQMLGGAQPISEEQAQAVIEQQDQAREEAQAKADETDDTIIPEQTAQLRQPAYRVVNGTGRPEMAKRFSTFFDSKGLRVTSMKNAGDYDHDVSVISYAPGYEEEAEKMAAVLPVDVELVEDEGLNAKVELTIGADLLAFDASLLKNKDS
jgi:Flp pilus assembly protein TadD